MASTQQQHIPSDLHLVQVAADYDGAILDIYASLDVDGYQLARITAHGAAGDMIPALSDSCITHFERWIERNCELSPAARRATARREVRAAYGPQAYA